MNKKTDALAALSGPVSSFRAAYRRAAKQIELECCDASQRDRMRELCYIIAEAYTLDPEGQISVGGEILSVGLVQEVFSELGYLHVKGVLDRYDALRERIANKRAYLRTALYNAVFEQEVGTYNDLRSVGLI